MGKNENIDIRSLLIDFAMSVNERDRNGEAVNVIDGLFAVARAIHDVADAIREHKDREPTP